MRQSSFAKTQVEYSCFELITVDLRPVVYSGGAICEFINTFAFKLPLHNALADNCYAMAIYSPILISEDALFHYTKASTAIEYILHTNELWLTPRHKMTDPIENVRPPISYDSSCPDYKSWDNQTKFDCSSLGEELGRMWQHAKQVSFCMNDVTQNPKPGYPSPDEFYGFLKPRMWDQYGDKYQGVCLAFSKNKICNYTNYTHQPIEYVKYSHLRRFEEINYDRMAKRKEAYIQNWKERKIESLFRKHQDYIGENEYRFMSFSENANDVIPVRDCLVGIFASEKISDFAKTQLLSYTDANKSIELYFVTWGSNGISIKNKEEQIKWDKSIESCFDN